MPKSTDAPIAYKKNAADSLALLELIREHIEGDTAEVQNRADRTGKDANWADVGSMAHIRDSLTDLLVGLRVGADESEEECREEVRMDVANTRSS